MCSGLSRAFLIVINIIDILPDFKLCNTLTVFLVTLTRMLRIMFVMLLFNMFVLLFCCLLFLLHIKLCMCGFTHLCLVDEVVVLVQDLQLVLRYQVLYLDVDVLVLQSRHYILSKLQAQLLFQFLRNLLPQLIKYLQIRPLRNL